MNDNDGAGGAGPDSGALHVTRVIPVPASISAEAQAVLRVGALVSASVAPHPPAADRASWASFVADIDSMMLASLAPQIDGIDTSVSAMIVGDLPVVRVTPKAASGDDEAAILLDIHGGAFVFGSGEACRVMAVMSAERTGLATWSPDYRMPPAHPFPAALDDCATVYRAMLETTDPSRILVGGGSAGANLAAALLLRARREGLPMPAGLLLLSPEIDLTESGDSFETNMGVDTVLTGRLTESISLYVDGRELTDPLISPLFADPFDLAAFPPTFLCAGTRDLFLSNAVRMHRKLRAAGVDAELHVFEAMPHGGFFGSPEDEELHAEMRRFVTRHTTTT